MKNIYYKRLDRGLIVKNDEEVIEFILSLIKSGEDYKEALASNRYNKPRETNLNKIYNAILNYFTITKDFDSIMEFLTWSHQSFDKQDIDFNKLIDDLFTFGDSFACLLKMYEYLYKYEYLHSYRKNEKEVSAMLKISEYLVNYDYKQFPIQEIAMIVKHDLGLRNTLYQLMPKQVFEDILKKNIKKNDFISLSLLLWNDGREILDLNKEINFEQYHEVSLVSSSRQNPIKYYTYIRKLIKSSRPILSLYILNKYEIYYNILSNAKLHCDTYVEVIVALKRYDILAKYYDEFDFLKHDFEFLQHIVKYFIDVNEINKAQIVLSKMSLLESKHPYITEAQLLIDKYNMIQKLFSENIDISAIDNLSGKDFEKMLIEKFKSLGFSAQHTATTGDFGADIIVDTNDDTRFIIQCKRFKNKVNLKAVQEVVASLKHYNGDIGIVITNNGFLSSAISLAESNGIELWDNMKLMKFLSSDISFSQMNDWKK